MKKLQFNSEKHCLAGGYAVLAGYDILRNTSVYRAGDEIFEFPFGSLQIIDAQIGGRDCKVVLIPSSSNEKKHG